MPETSGIMNGITEGFLRAGEKSENFKNVGNAINPEKVREVSPQLPPRVSYGEGTGQAYAPGGVPISQEEIEAQPEPQDVGWNRPDLANIYGSLPQGPRKMLPNGMYLDETQMEPEQIEAEREEGVETLPEQKIEYFGPSREAKSQRMQPSAPRPSPNTELLMQKVAKLEAELQASLDKRFKKAK